MSDDLYILQSKDEIKQNRSDFVIKSYIMIK